jgi:penicillin-binding protein 2
MAGQHRWLVCRIVVRGIVTWLLLMSALPAFAQVTRRAAKPVKTPPPSRPTPKASPAATRPAITRKDMRPAQPGTPQRLRHSKDTAAANPKTGRRAAAGREPDRKTLVGQRPSGKAAKTTRTTPAPGSRQASASVARTATASRNARARRDYTTRATAVRRTPTRAEAERAALRRRAEQARLAELARIRALDEQLQRTTQSSIEQDDLRGEDPAIRQLALDALGDRAGTVVVMEPWTGRVLSIVNQQWAVRTPFKPCSTIKVLTGYAALQEKLTTADEIILAGSRSWTLRTAMAQSNNEYFQVLAHRLGFERFLFYAGQAGFGRKTGINLPGETSGVIPRHPPADLGRMGSHGDGFGVTAVQLATFISALANGGTLYRPQVLRSPQEVARFKPLPVRTLPLTEDIRRDLLAGLVSAVERGTARRSGAAALGVAGKTGSCNCDFSPRTRVGLFVSFVDAPGKLGLLVTVITKGSMARGSSASVIAGSIYRGAEVASRTAFRRRVAPSTEEPAETPDVSEEETND